MVLKRKAWLWGSLASLAVLVLALAALPTLLDLERIKPHVQAWVAEHLQATLDYDAARLGFAGGPALRLTNVRLANDAPGYDGEEALRARSVALAVELWPLFRGRLAARLVVDEPVVQLRLGEGGNSWSAMTRDGPAPVRDDAAKAEDGSLAALERVSVRSIRVRGATVRVWKENVAETPLLDLSALDASVDDFALDQAFTMRVSSKVAYAEGGLEAAGPLALALTPIVRTQGGRFHEVTFEGRAELDALRVDARRHFVKPAGMPAALTLEGRATASEAVLRPIRLVLDGATATAAVTVRDFDEMTTVATLDVDVPDLARLAKLFPGREHAALTGPLTAEGRLDGPLARSEAMSASMKVRAALAGSDLSLDLVAPRLDGPRASIALAAKSLDLDRLLPQSPAPPPSSARSTGAQARPSGAPLLSEGPAARLKNARVDVAARIGEVRYGSQQITDLDAKARLVGTALTLESARFAAFDGRIAASARADLADPAPRLAGKITLADVQVAHILDAYLERAPQVLSGQVESAVDFSLPLGGAGESPRALDARGTFRFAEGAYLPKDLGASLEAALNRFFAGLDGKTAAGGAWQRIRLAAALPGAAGAAARDLEQGLAKLAGLRVDLGTLGRLDDLEGTFRVEQGRTRFAGAKSGEAGTLEIAGAVGLDLALEANGSYTASPSVTRRLTAAAPRSSLLLDRQSRLVVPFGLQGPVTAPALAVGTEPLLANARANAADELQTALAKQLGASDVAGELRLPEAAKELFRLKR